ncbi:enediyne biosynthesis protein CalE5 [Janthinobacterium sp. CG_23.3]|uniref:class I SAM-dependent methyltransferase n=1 Tax=Janthinobacterium sp. CG_23.3 TaxID=3349634 RepID=UPI0038D3CC83
MDSIVIKQEQRKNWNGLANAWGEWGDVFELGAAPVSKALFDMAGLKPGDQVLDIACGIGEPALSAGKIVGAKGKVVGIDIAEDMIAQAKMRGSASANVQCLAIDAAAYDIGVSCDAILSRFGFMFMPDYQEVFKTSYAALKSGGVLAFSVWDTPDQALTISMAVGFFFRELNLPPPKDLPNPFCMANTDLVGIQLAALGFKAPRYTQVRTNAQPV